MKRSRKYLLFLILLFTCSFSALAMVSDKNDWLEVPNEYREKIFEKLKEGKKYSEEQLAVIGQCLQESTTKAALSCFSQSGFAEVSALYVTIEKELGELREKLCGEKVVRKKDNCEQLIDQLTQLKNQLKQGWSTALEKGQKVLKKKNVLFSLKRKICLKIEVEGCWSWLNERIALKCDPGKFKAEPDKLFECQLAVVTEVWKKLDVDA